MAFRPPVKQRNDTIAYTKKSFWNEKIFLVNQSDSGERKERINKLFIGLM